MAKIVCTIGVIGGGKDFTAKQFIKDAEAFNQNMIHLNFADELREMAWDILGWRPLTDNDYETFKQSSLITDEKHRCATNINFTGRQFLQRLGTDAIRKRDKNFWVKCWFDNALNAIDEGKRIACSDARFVNEIDAVLKMTHYNPIAKSTFVFCDYKSDRYDCTNPHPSEALAQRVLKDGFKHGEMLPKEYLEKLIQDPELRKIAGM
jgi:hypothetical protein